MARHSETGLATFRLVGWCLCHEDAPECEMIELAAVSIRWSCIMNRTLPRICPVPQQGPTRRVERRRGQESELCLAQSQDESLQVIAGRWLPRQKQVLKAQNQVCNARHKRNNAHLRGNRFTSSSLKTTLASFLPSASDVQRHRAPSDSLGRPVILAVEPATRGAVHGGRVSGG